MAEETMSELIKAIRRRLKACKGYLYPHAQEDVKFLLTLIDDIDRQDDETQPLTHTERVNPAFWMPGKSEAQYLTFQRRYEVTLKALEEEVYDLKNEQGDAQLDIERYFQENEALKKKLAIATGPKKANL